MNLSYILNHLGEDREKYFNAVSPPIIQSSNFVFNSLDDFRKAAANELEVPLYTRGNNPTVQILRKKLAALEDTEDALVCASGSGAVAAAVVTQVQKGDHIVCVNAPYSWTKVLLMEFLTRFGVNTTFVDGTSIKAIEEAIQPNTKVLYLESPNSLTFECQDLEACGKLAKKHGLTSIIDNSYSSPLHQQPAKYGIDIMVHSGTKYLNGHGDVVVGVICGSKNKIQEIFNDCFMTLGAIISPHDASLVLRGLRTLELRLQRSGDSAIKLAQRLEKHPKTEQVLHPHLPSFPQYELAKKQISGAGGMFSVYFKADTLEAMERLIHQLIQTKRFTLAVSWGGHESLLVPTAAFHKIPGKDDSPLPYTLIRFYVGLEDPEWLWEGLEEALEVL